MSEEKKDEQTTTPAPDTHSTDAPKPAADTEEKS